MFPGVLFRFAVDETPDVAVEAAEFLLDFEEFAGVADCGRNFQAIADDAGIGEQLFDFFRAVAGDLLGIEAVEHFSIAFALAQDRVPAQTRLRAFQNKRSEEHTSELQSLTNLVCRLLLEKKKNRQ